MKKRIVSLCTINADVIMMMIRQANLILTPHIAGATNESKMRIISAAINNIIKVINGEKPDFIVNTVA